MDLERDLELSDEVRDMIRTVLIKLDEEYKSRIEYYRRIGMLEFIEWI